MVWAGLGWCCLLPPTRLPLRGRGGDSRQLWFPVSFLLRRMTGGRIRAVAAALCVPLPES
jgi:hypothetical protein